MTRASIAELSSAAESTVEPFLVARGDTKFGGVDPLGLRQINFDLMDEVFPGLNNVARHIRPFVVVTWAWRRALRIAKTGADDVIQDDALRDFVDRVEVLFLLSHLLSGKPVDIPGRQYITPLLAQSEFRFGGDDWTSRRKARANSTGLSSPLNYGPGLTMLGWLSPHPEFRRVMRPNPLVAPALDALQTALAPALHHPAFSTLGEVIVAREQAQAWGHLWSQQDVTRDEAAVMRELLLGESAPRARRLGLQLLLAAAKNLGDSGVSELRSTMSEVPSTFLLPPDLLETRDAWRRLQVRQAFRLALEMLLYWVTLRLHHEGPRSSNALIADFLSRLEPIDPVDTGSWLKSVNRPQEGPTGWIDELVGAARQAPVTALPAAIAVALASSLTEEDQDDTHPQQLERLPLSRGRRRPPPDTITMCRSSCATCSSPGCWPSMHIGLSGADWAMRAVEGGVCCV